MIIQGMPSAAYKAPGAAVGAYNAVRSVPGHVSSQYMRMSNAYKTFGQKFEDTYDQMVGRPRKNEYQPNIARINKNQHHQYDNARDKYQIRQPINTTEETNKQMNRNTRKILMWLVIGGTPPLVISGLMVMLAFLLLIMTISFSASLFGVGVQFGGQGSSAQQITSQQWTGQADTAVVSAALSLVSRLYNCGSADHTQCYTSMPQTDIDLWSSACPLSTACYDYWQSGDFQCVTFVTGAFHNAGQDLPDAPNAVDFWTDPNFTTSGRVGTHLTSVDA